MNRSLRSTVLFVVLVSVLSIPVFSQGVGVPKISGFIPNYGQWPEEVRYVLPNDNLNVWVTQTGIVFDQFSVEDAKRTGHVLRLTWTDANVLEQSYSKDVYDNTNVNIFTGASPGGWRNNMGLARSITFPNAWSGVDLVLYVDGANRFRYDFKVKPNADAKRIGFRVAGDQGMRISSDAVALKTSVGEVHFDNCRDPIHIKYTLR